MTYTRKPLPYSSQAAKGGLERQHRKLYGTTGIVVIDDLAKSETRTGIPDNSDHLISDLARRGYSPAPSFVRQVRRDGIHIFDHIYDSFTLAFHVGERVECFELSNGAPHKVAVYSLGGNFLCEALRREISEVPGDE